MPEGFLEAMINNDFEFAASNRVKILKKWQSRYDIKSEPKK
jgi:iron(III) transport system substrate-binding protein